MNADLPLSRQLASRIEVLPRTGSTNADLRGHASDAAGWPHLSVLLTEDQTAGRGRLDRSWVAPAGTALAISVLLRRLPSEPGARGWIPLVAGAAMADAVAAQMPHRVVAVKWPNDVLVDGKKICGILAEATDGAVIVGSGVNTAMGLEQLPVPTATSFAALGVDVDEDRLLADYLDALTQYVDGLAGADEVSASDVRGAVSARCATIGQEVRVSLPDGTQLVGSAESLDVEGRLVVAAADGDRAVSAGDVVHVRPV